MHSLHAVRPRVRTMLDGIVALLALAGTLAQLRHGGVATASSGAGLDTANVLLAIGSTLPLVLWRRAPFAIFVVTSAAGVLLVALGSTVDMLIGPAAALYMLAATRGPRSPWTIHTTATVGGMLTAYLLAAGLSQATFPAIELLHTGLAWAGAWFAGERTRLRREQLVELRRRAAQAEEDAERERLLAVAEERTRIARDLHDSAGHAISLIAVRSGAARLRQDPARALEVLSQIEGLARQTASEIDRTIVSLREGAADTPELPVGLASLDTLIRTHASTGLMVTLDVSGMARPLTTATDTAAYRILQEALNNAARHGVGDARIEVVYGAGMVELTVSNPVKASAKTRRHGGHGLIGMRERATLLGGTLDSGRVDGAFRVQAQLPDGAA